MKTIFTTLVFSFLLVTINAQPILTTSVTPEIGDSWDITFLEPNGFNPGSGGANQTWDFSGIDISNSLNLGFSILDPVTVVGHEDIPNADFVWYIEAFEIYQFYEITPDSISLVGGESISDGEVDFLTIYTDPENGLQLPLQFGESYTYYSVFDQYIFGNLLATNDRNGSVTADGYGTIITPHGTHQNVLRLIIEETSFGFTNTQYAWYDVNSFVPVLVYETSGDPETPPSLYYTTNDITSTAYNAPVNLEWRAWTNASANQINVELPALDTRQDITLLAYNLEGRLVTSKSVRAGGSSDNLVALDIPETVNFENLIVQLNTNEGSASKKVWIAR